MYRRALHNALVLDSDTWGVCAANVVRTDGLIDEKAYWYSLYVLARYIQRRHAFYVDAADPGLLRNHGGGRRKIRSEGTFQPQTNTYHDYYSYYFVLSRTYISPAASFLLLMFALTLQSCLSVRREPLIASALGHEHVMAAFR